MNGSDEKRHLLLHYHMFKNAGTSVDVVLQQNFADGWMDVEFGTPAHTHAAAIRDFIAEHPSLSAISSHTLMAPIPHGDNVEVLPIIFLRHPIERLRSVYEFERIQPPEASFGARLAKETGFTEYLEARWRRGDRVCRDAHSYRLWCMLGRSEPTERLTALAALDRLPCVGLVEAFDQSMAHLQAQARRYFPEFAWTPVWANASGDRTLSLAERLDRMRAQVGDTFYRRMEANNQIDLELYDIVRRRFVAE